MIELLTRWRQFGRRYFWQRLLLGMVAASLGLPAFSSSAAPAVSSRADAGNHDQAPGVNFTRQALPQVNWRPVTVAGYYWRHHAMHVAMHHLSFALLPQLLPVAEKTLPLSAQRDTPGAVLAIEYKPSPMVVLISDFSFSSHISFSVPAWISQAGGIRAGPQRLA